MEELKNTDKKTLDKEKDWKEPLWGSCTFQWKSNWNNAR